MILARRRGKGYILAMKSTKATAEARKRKLEERLKQVIGILPRYDVERAILFGSMARGDVGISSDIDLLIVRRTEAPFVRRPLELKEIKGVDLLVLTPEELEEFKERPFYKTILREGKLIYEKTP